MVVRHIDASTFMEQRMYTIEISPERRRSSFRRIPSERICAYCGRISDATSYVSCAGCGAPPRQVKP